MTRLACFYKTLDPRTRESLIKYHPQGVNVDWVSTPRHGYGVCGGAGEALDGRGRPASCRGG